MDGRITYVCGGMTGELRDLIACSAHIKQLKVTQEWNVQIADCYNTVIIRVMSTTLTELTLKYARMDIRIKQIAKIM